MRQAQNRSNVSIAHQNAVEPRDSMPLAGPVELDLAMLKEVSGAGPCGGWAPATSGPVTDLGPCGGW